MMYFSKFEDAYHASLKAEEKLDRKKNPTKQRRKFNKR
jgi:hypothetical protein